MRPEDYSFIIESLERPQGLFEIYRTGEIGPTGTARITALPSAGISVKSTEQGRYGLALKYGIHNEDTRLQLWVTRQSTEYPLRRTIDGKIAGMYHLLDLVEAIGRFSYGPSIQSLPLQKMGERIIGGETVGPLEHAVLQEALRLDPRPQEIRDRLGSSLVALGNFADELRKRTLSID